MNKLTVHFQTRNHPIDPEFLDRLEIIANEFGVSIDRKTRQTIEYISQNRKHNLDEIIGAANKPKSPSDPVTIDCVEGCNEINQNDIQSGESHWLTHDDFFRRASEISQRIGPVDSDSAEFLRSMRDRM